MKQFVFSLLLGLLALPSFAQTPTVLNSYVEVLQNNTLASFSAQLLEKGYTENKHLAFKENNMRVFTTEGKRDIQLYILEYCGAELTGYYTSLSKPENIILHNDLDVYKYNNVGNKYNKYRKKDITIDLITDSSESFPTGQSDTFGASRYYMHISKKNSCHNDDLESPLTRYYPFTVSSFSDITQMGTFTRPEVVIAMVKYGYLETEYNSTTGVSQFKKGEKLVTMLFCEEKVKVFINYLSKRDGEQLEESLKKSGFVHTKGQQGSNNSYTRLLENNSHNALFQYTGNVLGESPKPFPYRLIVGKKISPCD